MSEFTSGTGGPGHWLSANAAEWTPQHVAFGACTGETDARGDEARTVLTAWATVALDRARTAGEPGAVVMDSGTTAAAFTDSVDAWTAGKKATWLYLRNLPRVLALTGLTTRMIGAGWQVTGAGLGCASPWLRLRRGRVVLTVADWPAWLPSHIATVCRELGEPRIAEPQCEGGRLPDPQWCEQVSVMLAAAVADVLDWWDRNGMGKWTLTAAGCGYNGARHAIGERKIWIGTREGEQDYDRSAIYGGRRGCAVWGPQPPGAWTNEDFSQAHAHIVGYLPIPEGRLFRFDALHAPRNSVITEHRGVIAAALLDTRSARYPVRIGGRNLYARGRFWTVLAGPELAEAQRRHELAALGPGYAYRLGRVLSDQAKRNADRARGKWPELGRAVALFCKHSGRVLPGKMSARAYEEIDLGERPGVAYATEQLWNAARQEHETVTVINGRATLSRPAGSHPDSLPAIGAFVESYVRVRLGRAMDAMPAGSVAGWDTDGFHALDVTAAHRAAANRATGPLSIRRKASYKWIDYRGPQMYVTDARRVASGIPHDARWPEKWAAEYFTAAPLGADDALRENSGYRETKTVVATFPYSIMAWLCTNHRTVPLDLYTGQCGGIHSRPFERSTEAARGWELAADQSPEFLRIAVELAPVAPACVAELGAQDAPWDAGRVCPGRWGYQRPWDALGLPQPMPEPERQSAPIAPRVPSPPPSTRARVSIWRRIAWRIKARRMGYRWNPVTKSWTGRE